MLKRRKTDGLNKALYIHQRLGEARDVYCKEKIEDIATRARNNLQYRCVSVVNAKLFLTGMLVFVAFIQRYNLKVTIVFLF